jgi:hypothetical protein
MYPYSMLNCYSKGWYLIRLCPTSVDVTKIFVDYYMRKWTTNEEREQFLSFGKKIQKEVMTPA